MEIYFFWIGKIICLTGGLCLAILAIGVIGAVAGMLSVELLKRAMYCSHTFAAWKQMKKSHRIFFAWAIEKLKSGEEIRGVDRGDLFAAFKSWDPDNAYGWREALQVDPPAISPAARK